MSKSKVTRKKGPITLEMIEQRFAEVGAMNLTIGFQGPAALRPHSEGATIVDIATWQEMGTDTIPARPALRTAMTENVDKIRKFMIREAKRLLGTKSATARKMYARIGLFAVELVRDRYRTTRQWAVPLAASTLAARVRKIPGQRTGKGKRVSHTRSDSELQRKSSGRRAAQTFKRASHEGVTPLIDTGQVVQGVTYAIRRLQTILEMSS